MFKFDLNELANELIVLFFIMPLSQVRKEFIRKAAQWNAMKNLSSTSNTIVSNKVEPISMDSYDVIITRKTDCLTSNQQAQF
jgi:hypothetical protein